MSINCKIIVNYHKPSRIFTDPLYIPFNAGRALLQQKYEQGIISRSEKQWLLQNTRGDDSGDNISDLNYSFCELTVMYWIWKNYDKIENPDYIGFCHYRRIFDVDSETLDRFISDNHIIYAGFRERVKYETIYEQFCKRHKNDLDLCIDYFRLNNKDFYESLNEYLSLPFEKSALFNMFVVQKDIFFECCGLLFELLFDLKNKIDLSTYSFYGSRVFGFIAERIIGAFFYHKFKQGYRLKKSVPFFFENQYLKVSIANVFGEKLEIYELLKGNKYNSSSNEKIVNIAMPLNTENLKLSFTTLESCAKYCLKGQKYRVHLLCDIDRKIKRSLFAKIKDSVSAILKFKQNFCVSLVVLSEELLSDLLDICVINRIKKTPALWFLLLNKNICKSDSVFWINSGFLLNYNWGLSLKSLETKSVKGIMGCESFYFFVAKNDQDGLDEIQTDFSKPIDYMQTNFLRLDLNFLSHEKVALAKRLVEINGYFVINLEGYDQNVDFVDYYWSVETSLSDDYPSLEHRLSFDNYMKFSTYDEHWIGVYVPEVTERNIHIL